MKVKVTVKPFYARINLIRACLPRRVGAGSYRNEQNFDHEVEVDDNEEIENIENLSQNSNDFLSQEADNGVHYYVCY